MNIRVFVVVLVAVCVGLLMTPIHLVHKTTPWVTSNELCTTARMQFTVASGVQCLIRSSAGMHRFLQETSVLREFRATPPGAHVFRTETVLIKLVREHDEYDSRDMLSMCATHTLTIPTTTQCPVVDNLRYWRTFAGWFLLAVLVGCLVVNDKHPSPKHELQEALLEVDEKHTP